MSEAAGANGRDFEERVDRLKAKVKSYPGFPKPPVVFRDMFSLMLDPRDIKELIALQHLAILRSCPEVEAIAMLESRGFIFAVPLAERLEVPVIPIRKHGKLPGRKLAATYQLEYGEDHLEIQEDVLKPGTKVLIVDDLLATGGTLEAATSLVERSGAVVSLLLVIMELPDLQGRQRLSKYKLESLIQF
ncbi:unnamed protein product [Cyprideis torosa]|uniref:Adenine phosphoribosyltransferase n=1 Tax=Cyprideis torosa TaxID=163714 RepID=A0A7R8W843_9CRUS|nr:unnamed protein product [Cyprideis torosa]CAG0883061.1 unnamed protein product [Cyprideis torosa]